MDRMQRSKIEYIIYGYKILRIWCYRSKFIILALNTERCALLSPTIIIIKLVITNIMFTRRHGDDTTLTNVTIHDRVHWGVFPSI